MTRAWHTGFRGRLAVLVVLTVLPLFLGGTFAALHLVRRDVARARVREISGTLRDTAVDIGHDLESVRGDVRLLAATPPPGGLVRAWAHGGVDPRDGSTVAHWRGRMTQIWEAAVATGQMYDHVAFLDGNGREVVRVDFEEGRAVAAPAEALRDERTLDAFVGTAALATGQVFVSPVSSRRAPGRPGGPGVPLIRVATPVLDDAGRRQGAVIAAVRVAAVARHAGEQHNTAPGEVFVADARGRYLYRRAARGPAPVGGPGLDSDARVQRDYPYDWAAILGGKPGSVARADRLVLFEIAHLRSEPGEFLVVGTAVPAAAVGTVSLSRPEIVRVVLLAFGLLAAVLGAIVWPLGRAMVRPLAALLAAMERFTRGDLRSRADPSTGGEVGRLAQAFNDMAVSVSSERAQLETEVRERTAKLEASSRVALSMLQDAELARTAAAAALRDLETATGELDHFFTLSLDLLCIADTEGRFRRLNAAWEDTLGFRRAELLAGKFLDFVHPDDAAATLAAMGELSAGRPVAGFANRYRHRDGSHRWLEWRAASDGTLVYAAARDVTAQRDHEEALRRARTAAEDASLSKSAFLANMSHEIRTPMNAILGFAQLLRRDGALTALQRQHVGTILRGGEHLLELITDILEYSKIEAGRVNADESTFDLHDVLADLEVMFRLRAEAKGLRLAVEHCDRVLHYVVTDETKVRQILQNLLANAVKFTEHGGVALRTRVEPGPAGAAAQRLVVEVEDSGPGIAPEELHRLFQVFEQTASGRKTRSGTGLGLAISRRFAELLGGTLEVESREGVGSTFRLEIPIREGDAASVRRGASPRRVTALASGQPALRVLVADDLADNRAFLVALLAAVGFEVRAVDDGARAVSEFAIFAPQLVLMDMRMPVMTGREAIGRIRASAGGAAVKIIAVTASAFREDREAALEAGADDYVSKPFREEVLFEKIGALLGVQYQYDDAPGPAPEAAPPAPAADLRAGATALPRELAAQLRQATLSADLDRLLELAAKAEGHCPPVAAEVRRLASSFAYQELHALLDERTEAS